MKKIIALFLLMAVLTVLLTGCDVLFDAVNGDESNKVATPIFSPQPGVFGSAQQIAIACATSGADIYYSTDGSIPTIASTFYSGSISVSGNTTIKAMAIKSGMEDSDIAVGHYFIGSGEGKIVGMLFTEGGLGDQGYNDGSLAGLLEAQDEFDFVSTYQESEGSYTSELEALADEGAELVFGIGFEMAEAIKAAAASRPDAFFAGIDIWCDPADTPDNAKGILFREQESGYLAGIVAGFLTKEYAGISTKLNDDNIVGMVKGMDIAPVNRFATGFYAGVKIINPDCEVLSRTSGDFGNEAQGRADAQEMIGLGADIIFNIAGLTGIGAMEAARDAGVLAIGVDVDQNHIFPDTIITSAIKDVSTAVTHIAGMYFADSLTGGDNIVLGLTEEATGIAPFHGFDGIMPQEVKDALDEAVEMIISDELIVPEFMDDMLNIGVAGPHSGDLADFGIPALQTMQFLAMEVNQDGGLLGKYVNIVEGNDGCNSTEAPVIAQDLVDSNVTGVIGHICSGATEAALNVYEPLDIPVLSPSSTRPSLTQSGNYPNFFRTIRPDDSQAGVLVDFAASTLGASSVAVVYDSDSDYGTDNAGYVNAAITALSGISNGFEQAIDFDTDYSAHVTSLGAAGVDAVIFHGNADKSAEFLIALRDASIDLPFLIWENAATAEFITAAGANTADVYAGGQLDFLDTSAAEPFVASFNEYFGEDPGAFAVNAYAAGKAMVGAITAADSTDGPDIISALDSGTFDTPFGEIGFDSNGDITGDVTEYRIYGIQGGDFVLHDQLVTMGPGSSEMDPLIIGVVPEDAEGFAAKMDTLIALLEAETGIFYDQYIGTNYEDLQAAAEADPPTVHLTVLNTFGYLTSTVSDTVEAAFISERYGSTTYSAQIIAGSETGINSVADLSGKTFSRPDPYSTSGWMFPVLMMLADGVDPYADLANIVTAEGHTAAADNVYNGVTDAGGTYVDARNNLTYGDTLDKINVVALSIPIPNDGIQILSSLTDTTKDAITANFESLAGTSEGLASLNDLFSWDTIIAEDDTFYDGVRGLFTDAGLTVEELKTLIDNEFAGAGE